MNTRKIVIAFLMATLIIGKVSGQKQDLPPEVKPPDSFRGVDPNTPSDQNSIGDLKWFEVLRDVELQKLVRTASAAYLIATPI